MEWIFDASVTMAWCFADERTPETDALLDKIAANVPAIVPQVWPLEIANVLTLAARKGKITAAKRRQFLAMLENAMITVDSRAMKDVFNDVLSLSDKYRLTSYDASYLELAMRLGLPLATLDKELKKSAQAAGVRLLI